MSYNPENPVLRRPYGGTAPAQPSTSAPAPTPTPAPAPTPQIVYEIIQQQIPISPPTPMPTNPFIYESPTLHYFVPLAPSEQLAREHAGLKPITPAKETKSKQLGNGPLTQLIVSLLQQLFRKV
jgi:hypothetical protein